MHSTNIQQIYNDRGNISNDVLAMSKLPVFLEIASIMLLVRWNQKGYYIYKFLKKKQEILLSK